MAVTTTALAGGGTGGGGGGTPGQDGTDGTNGVDGKDGVGFRAPAALAYSANLAINCANAETFNVAALTGNVTLAFSGAVDGQKILVNLQQDATGGRTVAFGPEVAFSADMPSIALSTAAGASDALGFIYHAASGKYRAVSHVKGF